MKKILLIPDTQVKPNVPTDHLLAMGNYIVAKQPEIVVMIGDWWDMESLNSYEKKGSKFFEGKRVMEDISSGNDAMDLMMSPIKALNANRTKNKKRHYKPRMVFCMGNHEYRINRAVAADPALEGLISPDMLNLKGWEVHPFLDIVDIEGVWFSHYFVNTLSLTKGVLSGTIDNKLQKIGNSFVMGHQQTLQFGTHYNNGGDGHIGLVAGAFYQHHEDYMGKQGNHHWRGAVMLNQVEDGKFDPMFLSLDYFLREWI